MINNFILILIVQSIAALFFTFFGKILIEKTLNNSYNFSQKLKLSMSYFTGVTIFFSLYRFFGVFFNSFYSFIFTSILIIIVVLFDLKQSYFYSILIVNDISSD